MATAAVSTRSLFVTMVGWSVFPWNISRIIGMKISTVNTKETKHYSCEFYSFTGCCSSDDFGIAIPLLNCPVGYHCFIFSVRYFQHSISWTQARNTTDKSLK